MLTSFIKKQQGAMFGLDARIALAIFAGLSIITGTTMIQVLENRRVNQILFEHQKFSGAVDALQNDLQGEILTSSNTAVSGHNIQLTSPLILFKKD